MEKIERDILDLIKQGYDICVPGGTGRNGSNASFGALGVRLANGNPEIIIIPVKRKPFEEYVMQQKGSLKAPFEAPIKILDRELKEELKVTINIKKTFRLTDKAEWDSRNHTKIHRKYLFVIENYDARTMRKHLTAGEPNLGIPMSIPMHLFKKYIWEGHRWMVEPILIYFKYRSEYFPPKRQIIPLREGYTHLQPALAS